MTIEFAEFRDEVEEICRCCEGIDDGEVVVIAEKEYNDRLRKLFEKVKK